MTLQELLKDLTYGELARLKLGGLIPGGDFEAEVDPSRYEQLLTHINMGLKEIYKRFFLLSREIYVEEQEEIAVYTLSRKYAQSNTASTIPIEDRYIADSVDQPFLDDVLKIEEVYDEGGNKLPLNDITEELSIFTPSYRSIQIPYPKAGNTMAVQYRACHPKVEYDAALEPEDVELAVPNSLHEALLFYVASRAWKAKGGETGMAESIAYFQQFQNSCDLVEKEGLEVQGEPGIWRFDERGWV